MDKNGYNLSREWFNFKIENPEKTRPFHTELLFYIIDLWNRVGQKEKFNLPTFYTMEMLGIGSRSTLYNGLKDLENWGFITTITESRNQKQARIISIKQPNGCAKTEQAVAQAIAQADEQPSEQAVAQNNNKKTKNNRKKLSRSDFSEKTVNLYEHVKPFFKEGTQPKNEKQIVDWLDTLYKANSIDGYSYKDIYYIIKWARNDEFWKTNFLSVNKLRQNGKDGVKTIDRLYEKMNSTSGVLKYPIYKEKPSDEQSYPCWMKKADGYFFIGSKKRKPVKVDENKMKEHEQAFFNQKQEV